jgi:hypothetical protein
MSYEVITVIKIHSVFFMGPPRDYIRGTEQNQMSPRTENENGASPRQSRKKGSAED